MSRVAAHGGDGWEFGQCLWSPTSRKGGGKWGYWELMNRVREGDTILHLRGKSPKAFFVGYSTADSDCYETTTRPPFPGDWDHAERFYRVPLRDFAPFDKPLSLDSLFEQKRDLLIEYHDRHSPASAPNGQLLFYVQQSGKLQCQNGAYLSQLESELAEIILGTPETVVAKAGSKSVDVGTQKREVICRIGQKSFSDAVRKNFGYECCFPGCSIADPELLVGAHIARWADEPELRGDPTNGLCLCLIHDRLFEIGVYTLTLDGLVWINNAKAASIRSAKKLLAKSRGQPIKAGAAMPSSRAIRSHWQRLQVLPD